MTAGPRGAFGALYPDGSVYLATSTVDRRRARVARWRAAVGGPTDAALYKTDDGSVVPRHRHSGRRADADVLARRHAARVQRLRDRRGARPRGDGLRHRRRTRRATIACCSWTRDAAPGWPFVLPDNDGVVFARTDGTTSRATARASAVAARRSQPGSRRPIERPLHRRRRDRHGHAARAGDGLRHAGRRGEPTRRICRSAPKSCTSNYFPTVSPVAAGGYFWVFFDSVRHYGNLGMQRQLWGAAIDIAADGTYARRSAAIPRSTCRAKSSAPATTARSRRSIRARRTATVHLRHRLLRRLLLRDEIRKRVRRTHRHVHADADECSNTNERCTTDADCCPPANGRAPNMCIAGFCAMLLTPQ